MVMHIRNAALRRGLGQLVRARRWPVESGAGCMVGSALVLRAAAGTATTGAGTGLRRRSRSADGCDRSSRRLPKQDEIECALVIQMACTYSATMAVLNRLGGAAGPNCRGNGVRSGTPVGLPSHLHARTGFDHVAEIGCRGSYPDTCV